MVGVKGQGHQKKIQVSFDRLTGYHKFEVKGHLDQDKRSHGSMSKVDIEGQGQRSPCQNVISGLISQLGLSKG